MNYLKKKLKKTISFIKYFEDKYYIGFENGLFQIFLKTFELILEKKYHSSIILNIFILENVIITFSITETIIWDRNIFSVLKNIYNGLFFKIFPFTEKIIFGSISGDLFFWNRKEDDIKLIPNSSHINPILDIKSINENFFISYSSNELIIWKKDSLVKKKYKKEDEKWISIIEKIDKEYILVGFYDIFIYSINTLEKIKKINGIYEKIYSILPLYNNYFLTSTNKCNIYLYSLDNKIKYKIILKPYSNFPYLFEKTEKDILFFYKDTMYSFQNPLLKKEEENYSNFIKLIEKNKKEHSIFHNKDLIYYISLFLF